MLEKTGPKKDLRSITMIAAISIARYNKFYGFKISPELKKTLKNLRIKRIINHGR